MRPRIYLMLSALFVSLLFLVIADLNTGAKEMGPTKPQPPSSAEEICPLLAGATVPKLTYKTADGASFDLNAAIKEKPTVLIYYRGGW